EHTRCATPELPASPGHFVRATTKSDGCAEVVASARLVLISTASPWPPRSPRCFHRHPTCGGRAAATQPPVGTRSETALSPDGVYPRGRASGPGHRDGVTRAKSDRHVVSHCTRSFGREDEIVAQRH